MAIPILSRVKSALPFGNDPGLQAASSPTEQLLGHTAQLPDPSTIKPRIGMAPMGASGRANFYGLPQWDELNPKLVGQRGMLLLDEMYRTDAHIRRLILAGWSPVVAGTWTLEPYGAEEATDQDRQIADAVWWMLTQWMSPNFYEHLYQLGPILLRSGFAPFEQIWGTCEYKGKTLLGPRKLDVRLPKTVWRWWQDDFGDLTHIGQLLPNKADVVIPASELVYYRLGAEGDNWMGVSLLRHAYKHWYLKDKFERLDAVGQERRAVGVPIAYHSPDIDPQILDGVEAALANMHMSEVAYLMLPGFKMGEAPQDAGHGNQWLIDVIQFDSSSGPGIQSSIDYHQTAISASFLTDFLELGHHQVGARATAEVQEDPFLTAINGALLPPVIPPLNRLIDRIVKLNWDGAKGSPQLRLTLNDEASLSEIAAYVVPLIQAGAMQADPDLEDWLRDRADMPPANQEVRDMKQAASEAALQNAAQMAQRGETPGEEPPGANSDPAQQGAGAKPPAPASSPAGTTPPGDATATLKKTAAAKPSNGKQLDDAGAAPLSGGTATADGLQMVPEVLGGEKCTCKVKDGARVRWGDCPVHGEDVKATARNLDSAAEPTAKWFERLLSQDQLRQAFDGCRDHIQAAVGPAAQLVARQQAHHAANGTPMTNTNPPAELVDALTKHYTDMYQLGHQTVTTELAKQRAALGKTLDDPASTDAGLTAASRLAKARQRGEHSAQNIVAKINERLGRDQITGLKDPAALQKGAEQAAAGQLRMEALANTAASVNDGRADAATSAPDVAGAYVTSVLDERTCGPCEEADDGTLLSIEDAMAFGPPNPDCEGGDFCRCALVWVLSDDPAAMQAAF